MIWPYSLEMNLPLPGNILFSKYVAFHTRTAHFCSLVETNRPLTAPLEPYVPLILTTDHSGSVTSTIISNSATSASVCKGKRIAKKTVSLPAKKTEKRQRYRHRWTFNDRNHKYIFMDCNAEHIIIIVLWMLLNLETTGVLEHHANRSKTFANSRI